MPNTVSGGKAVCPFYVSSHSGKLAIGCESVIKNGKCSYTLFSSIEKHDEHFNTYCMTFNYKNCPVALALSGKY